MVQVTAAATRQVCDERGFAFIALGSPGDGPGGVRRRSLPPAGGPRPAAQVARLRCPIPPAAN